ncbi:MAG TPA: pilus assembly PilX N-terminal domain-containing protein [Thermoanaerobaculia bacterium]|nr:pilus assembly PilX N-terminal domain-containing protein [Thermoanaerobaculia bacterium]
MKRHRTSKQNESGSSLLVSLMVIAGLSLLGLGFVAISETESAISVNERNYTQTLQVAEAGARSVAEWFNAPEFTLATGLMPANDNDLKQTRTNASYTGVYKPDTAMELLCDIPFGQDSDRFYGVDAASADIVITRANADGAAFLDQFNSRILTDAAQGGRIVEIRIYGPPVVGGTFTTTGGLKFWNRNVGVRYGLATIAVTAEKTRDGLLTGTDNSPVIARRTVRVVVAELPLPGAEGPLQSHSGTGTTGNFRVHWGKAISNNDMAVKRLHTSLPWIDAWERIPFQEGYMTYDPARPKYLYELINKGFEDPWFEVRARAASTPPPGSPAVSGTNQLWLYTAMNDVENAVGTSGYSGHFQFQNEDNRPLNKRNVLFSRPVYEIWKQIAMAGAGQQGIYYLRYVSGSGHTSLWRDTRGISKAYSAWVNVAAGGGEGFFFFDTTDGSNPQLPNGATNTTVLTPTIDLPSAAGNPFKMRGFFYMNMQAWGSSGLQTPPGYYGMPGEPFQDIGVHVADTVTGQLKCTVVANPTPVPCATNPGSTPKLENFTNREWNFQDLNNNGVFDYKMGTNAAAITPSGTDSGPFAAGTLWLPIPYSDACGIAGVGTTCSEPHEPYLNLVYPADYAFGAGSTPNPVVPKWEDPASQTRRPKKQNAAGVRVTCNAASPVADCTSNTYDKIGPLVILGGSAGDGPVVEGIIYNEGNYDASGNATYYGAVLVQGTVGGSGTPTVFFDESLSRGDWANKFKNLPRTIMTTIETDQ